MSWKSRLVVLVLGTVLGLSSCAPPPTSTHTMSTSALSSHLSRLVSVAPDDSVAAARRARYASDRLRQARVQPVLRGSYFVHPGAPPGALRLDVVDPSRAHVMGYVAGRNPRVASELVLLTADLSSAGAAAVLEAAAALVAAGLGAIAPEATVGIALWAPPRTGVLGARDYIGRPPWSLEGISRVIYVTEDTTGVAAKTTEWQRAGIPVEIVTPMERPGPVEERRREARQLASAYGLAHAALRSALFEASAERVRSTAEPAVP